MIKNSPISKISNTAKSVSQRIHHFAEWKLNPLCS
jgi:hypothetical protein